MKLELTNQFPEIATELCQSVINLITDAVIAIDHQGIITLINPATEKIFGFGAAELIGQNISILMPSPFQEQHDGYIENYHRTGEKKVIGIGRELFGQKKDGSIFPMKLTVNDLTIKEHKLFIGIIRDISDKVELRELNQAKTELEENYSQAQEIQAQVVASLREKEILIKEIHHRVKNNLQLINSLLNLRLRRDNNLTAEEVINEIKNRIQAISLIHEMLYQEKDKAHLDLKSYFTQLINYLILSHS
ncbi:MAG: PAS domain S-box protein, partial [Proteobacteria bacterium]|nr:PAS domain S-box protein [Pseudomonadota bacterium]